MHLRWPVFCFSLPASYLSDPFAAVSATLRKACRSQIILAAADLEAGPAEWARQFPWHQKHLSLINLTWVRHRSSTLGTLRTSTVSCLDYTIIMLTSPQWGSGTWYHTTPKKTNKQNRHQPQILPSVNGRPPDRLYLGVNRFHLSFPAIWYSIPFA